ncbi:MAG TPA: HDOD domain-containing protein, partial [Rhodospirillaceae bacterium]|nr:HDOD domain-containing protein [Rhodospirillaceae bacterium]
NLAGAVERTLAIRRQICAPDLMALISRAHTIPVLPDNLARLFALLGTPNVAIAEVADAIAADLGLTAQILKLVNTAFFATPADISDVAQAVELLGFELIRSIAVLTGSFQSFQRAGVDLQALLRLTRRSESIAIAAQRIARLDGLSPEEVDHCQSAGLLAHVGSLMLFANWPGEMYCVQQELDRAGGGIIAAERRHFEAAHPEIGAGLLRLWGFNDAIVEAVLHHHAPSAAGARDRIGPLAVVHAAQRLVKPGAAEMLLGGGRPTDLDMDFLAACGAAERLAEWARLCLQDDPP